MATQVQIGQTVRINERYAEVLSSTIGRAALKKGNQVGVEFVVTGLGADTPPDGLTSRQIIKGDPNGWGVWGDYVDVVPTKTNTQTLISTRLNYDDVDRIVRVVNGRKGLGLTVAPDPSIWGDKSGTTNLTPEQAEELAHDLLARVAEIRGGQN